MIWFATKSAFLRMLTLTAALIVVPLAALAATVTEAPWGKTAAGDAVYLYTITAPHAEVKISTYGARC